MSVRTSAAFRPLTWIAPLACALVAALPLRAEDLTDGYLPACNNHNDCCKPCHECDDPPTEPSSTHSRVAKNLRYRHYAYDYRAPKSPTAGGCSTGCGGSFPTLPGLPALELERVHYEDTQLPSSLGVNWSFTQDVWLVVYPPGSVASGRPTGVPGWQVLVAKPQESPIDFFVAVDGAGTGTFQDGKSGYFKSLQFFTAGGVLTADPSLAASAVFTEWSGETWTFEMFTEAPGSVLGRPVRFADRNGNAIVHTWKYAVGDASLAGSLRSKLRIREAITDAYGRSARFTYDESRQHSGQWVTTRIDLPNGAHLDYGYGTQQEPFGSTVDKLSSVGHPDGAVSTFAMGFDAAKNCTVWSVSDPVAEPQSRFKRVWLTASPWIDPANPKHQYGQIFGRVRQIVDGAGEVSFQATIKTVAKPDGTNESRTYFLNQGRLRAVVHSGGDQATAVYERAAVDDGRPFFDPTADWSGWTRMYGITPGPAKLTAGAFVDAMGHAQARTIDPQTDAVLAQTHADGSVETFERNGFLQPTRVVDRAGRVTERSYDAAGNRVAEVRGAGTPDAGAWTWIFWTAADADSHRGRPGQVRSAIDARGQATDYFYHPSGDLFQVVEPADVAGAPRATTTYEVDAAGRCTAVIDPVGRRTTYRYDGCNRQVGVGYADGSEESWTFATAGVDAGLKAASADRNGHVTTWTHDAVGRTIVTTRAAGLPEALIETTAFLPGNQTLPILHVIGGDAVSMIYDRRLRKISESRFTSGDTALTTVFSYDDANRLVAERDAFGSWTYRVYDADDRIARTVRELVPGGVPTGADPATLSRLSGPNPPYVIEDQAYDPTGLVLERVDGRGVRSAWSYDAQGRQIRSTEAVGAPEAAISTTVYDVQGNVIETVDPRGIRTVVSYSGRNLRLSRTEAYGTAIEATTAWTYTPTRKIASETDPLGRTTLNSYGSCCDRLVQVADALGFLTRFTYDPAGNRLTTVDANGVTTAMAYDGRNRVVGVTNGVGETTAMQYVDDAGSLPEAAGLGFGPGADGSAVIAANALGERDALISDGLGRVVRRIDGLGHATTTAYDRPVVDGGVALVAVAVSDPLGQTTTALLDAAGRARVGIDPAGARSTAGYDAVGNRVTWRDANGVGKDCIFDGRNRDVSCTDTAGAVTARIYDANGNLLATTDALGQSEVSVFDARNRRTSTTDRIDATTTFAYDLVSNLVRITDAEGGSTDYRYEARNLLDREVFPPGQAGRTARWYAYDAGRRLTTRQVAAVGAVPPASAPASAERTAYAYDGAGRLTGRAYADGKDDAFAYDRASRLASAASARYGNRIERGYDAAGRLAAETLRFTAGAQAGIALPVGYAYDDADRLVRLTYPDGKAVQRGYDARGRLTGLWDDGTTVLARTSGDLDAGGRVIRTRLGNGLIETRSYVAGQDQVAGIAIPGVIDLRYEYDAVDRTTAEIDGIIADQTQRFAYDGQSRLVSWKRTGPGAADPVASRQVWDLSPVGDWNRTIIDGTPERRTHTAVHETTRVGGAQLRYDAKGNLVRDQEGQAFAWDPENHLSSATDLRQEQGSSATYAYDALGRRVCKRVVHDLPRTSAAGLPPAAARVVETVFVSAGFQEILEITGDPSASPWLGGGDAGDPESAGAAPVDPATGKGVVGSLLADPAAKRFNFQPSSSDVPAGWTADTGAPYGVQPDGQTFGWSPLLFGIAPEPTPIDRDRLGRPLYDTLAFLTRDLLLPQQWSVALPNGSYPVVILVGDASSRVHTDSLVVNGTLLRDPTPWDGRLVNGYEEGQFDAITAQVQVANGRLAIQPAWLAGALFPRINFIEIGSRGTRLDQATITRARAAAEKATRETGKPKLKTPPLVKRNVWGTYVDELVSYTVQRPRSTPVRSYALANRLHSVSAVANAAGQVVSRYGYDAYGKRTIMNAAGAAVTVDPAGPGRGFTGYTCDSETGLCYARARMYAPKLGRFIGRDAMRYVDGANAYAFAKNSPGNHVDPTGLSVTWADPSESTDGTKNEQQIAAIMTANGSTPDARNRGYTLALPQGSPTTQHDYSSSEKCPCKCWIEQLDMSMSLTYYISNQEGPTGAAAAAAHERGHGKDWKAAYADAALRKPVEDAYAAKDGSTDAKKWSVPDATSKDDCIAKCDALVSAYIDPIITTWVDAVLAKGRAAEQTYHQANPPPYGNPENVPSP